MRDAPEVVREVGVDDFRMASEQQPFHLDHRLLGVSPRTVRILFWWKVGFRSVPAPALLLSCRPDLARSTQPHRTALQSRQPLGSAEVIHPFHPLCGHRFVVLKVRRVSGVETLSLRHADLGSFALPREWTDWAPPGAQTAPTGVQPLLVDAFGLLGLAELVARLTRNDGA